MLQAERLERIRDYLVANKYASIAELAEIFQTSPATIRRSLKELEQKRIVENIRGGAVIRGSGNTFEHPYPIKRRRNETEKKRIAAYATSLVSANSSIYLDASSTVREMADALHNKQGVCVCTNDVQIAADLSSAGNLTVMVTGGVLRQGYYSLSGHFAEDFVNRIQVDYAFMGIDVISRENGLMLTNIDEIGIKQKICSHAGELIVLADHEKFNQTTFIRAWDFSEVALVITGTELPDEVYNEYLDLGLKIKRV
ncbi:MAG: DeoR/GlpR transcriptional regulator [Oscillospiraceae bacterium]|nr:DeoR/GlpR transcriptional regulator [Oscillospiraceae bacterium]